MPPESAGKITIVLKRRSLLSRIWHGPGIFVKHYQIHRRNGAKISICIKVALILTGLLFTVDGRKERHG